MQHFLSNAASIFVPDLRHECVPHPSDEKRNGKFILGGLSIDFVYVRQEKEWQTQMRRTKFRFCLKQLSEQSKKHPFESIQRSRGQDHDRITSSNPECTGLVEG